MSMAVLMRDPLDLQARNEIEARRRYHRELFDSAWGKFRSLTKGSRLKAVNPKVVISGPIQPSNRDEMILWMVDFQIAGTECLSGRELDLFRLRCLNLWSREKVIKLMKLSGGGAFDDLFDVVQEKVGAQIEERGLWPLKTSIGTGYLD